MVNYNFKTIITVPTAKGMFAFLRRRDAYNHHFSALPTLSQHSIASSPRSTHQKLPS
jgi:hypothetical protein